MLARMATSKTDFARSTAMRVSFCTDGLLLAYYQHRLWHIDADSVGGGVISSMKLLKGGELRSSSPVLEGPREGETPPCNRP
jgi:hypothetical protein